MRSFLAGVALSCVLLAAPAIAQQQQMGQEQQQGDEAAETISPEEYTGQWTLPQGPLRLEWNLEAEQYEFYVYEGESVRVGSRGTLEVNGRELTFTAEEVTRDGENWQPVQVADESRATRTFHATVDGESLRLASPETTIFYVEYFRPEAVPAGMGSQQGAPAQGADGGTTQGGGTAN